MNTIRSTCRPKHQVLILKCYPKLPPHGAPAGDIKPNSSELSYLLYYASTRRSKLAKVGAFLERRTAADLYKNRSAHVGVTLQILAAMLGNAGIAGGGGGFGIIAPYVLRILREVLGGCKDTATVEASLEVWHRFCERQDHASLSADAAYRALWEDVVGLWAAFAKKEATKILGSGRGKTDVGVGDTIRLRKAGLEAFRSVIKSEALASETGRQLGVVMPVVLQNLDAPHGDYLESLMAREKEVEAEKETFRHRQSLSTIRTTEEGDPRAASGTAADMDKYAEEEAALLALQVLRTIFDTENRGLVRAATVCLLKYIATQRPRTASSEKARTANNSWATTLFEIVCTWTPVQDRFVALFTAVETLIRSPIREDDLHNQLVLAQIVSHVLGSDVNLIGLSVMDVLLGLIQHILLVLQLGTTNTALSSMIQNGTTSSEETLDEKPRHPAKIVMEVVKTPSTARLQLLRELRLCTANLATHVYYTEQISDMLSAILLRLKPSSTPSNTATAPNPLTTASAIADPTSAAADVASNASLRERPNTDGFFSFDTARVVALSAVKDIITTANASSAGQSANRNSVRMSVWEGTQWLLRDVSAEVRNSYIDALTTWLRLEARPSDTKLEEDRHASEKERKERDAKEGEVARRAVSSASRAGRKGGRRSIFLQLLHLAAYEDALARADAPASDNDCLLLHYLLVTLVAKLGVNAVRTGLPMVCRLWEDAQSINVPAAKARIESLVLGYLWQLSETYDFEHSGAGRAIQAEILKKKKMGQWLEGVQIPALAVVQIAAISTTTKRPTATDSAAVGTEGEEAFNLSALREQIIHRISAAYSVLILSPPATAPLAASSVPGSPGRSFSLPSLSLDANAPNTPTHLNPNGGGNARQKTLPGPVIEELLGSWSKDSVIASIAAAVPKSASLSGSRTGASYASRPFHLHGGNAGSALAGNHRSLLAATNTFPLPTAGTPRGSGSVASATRNGSRGELRGSVRRGPGAAKGQRVPSHSASRSPIRGHSVSTSGSGVHGTGRVDELKRILAGGGGLGAGLTTRDRFEDDTGSESMMDVGDEYDHGADEEGSRESYGTPPEDTNTRDMVSASGTEGVKAQDGRELRNGTAVGSVRSTSRNRLGMGGKRDLSDLLGSIDVGDGEGDRGIGARPPY
ncbi:plasma membrane localization protein [Zalaria obscura]|uniref:Plasma membrane localization protein n=1 Tax=Zalaria obscura TaxID=2024903 RepID=A0ACC3SHV0_9PEZI